MGDRKRAREKGREREGQEREREKGKEGERDMEPKYTPHMFIHVYKQHAVSGRAAAIS